jgi:ribosomal 30S subunit maturation factor RimM
MQSPQGIEGVLRVERVTESIAEIAKAVNLEQQLHLVFIVVVKVACSRGHGAFRRY